MKTQLAHFSLACYFGALWECGWRWEWAVHLHQECLSTLRWAHSSTGCQECRLVWLPFSLCMFACQSLSSFLPISSCPFIGLSVSQSVSQPVCLSASLPLSPLLCSATHRAEPPQENKHQSSPLLLECSWEPPSTKQIMSCATTATPPSNPHPHTHSPTPAVLSYLPLFPSYHVKQSTIISPKPQHTQTSVVANCKPEEGLAQNRESRERHTASMYK